MEQMKRTFKHLQYRDRIKIEMMLREKASIQQIADRLHVTYQTIWRELRRDGVWYEHTLSNLTTERRYSADIAQAQYEKNKRAKGGMIKLGHDFALHDFIEQKIGREHYSPAAVIMEIKLRGLKFDVDICEKTIYNYINSGDVFFSITNKDLPQRGEHKREYKKVREAKRQAPGEGIENRPPEIDERKEEGHSCYRNARCGQSWFCRWRRAQWSASWKSSISWSDAGATSSAASSRRSRWTTAASLWTTRE